MEDSKCSVLQKICDELKAKLDKYGMPRLKKMK